MGIFVSGSLLSYAPRVYGLVHKRFHIDGSVQDCSISSALAVEILHSKLWMCVLLRFNRVGSV